MTSSAGNFGTWQKKKTDFLMHKEKYTFMATFICLFILENDESYKSTEEGKVKTAPKL